MDMGVTPYVAIAAPRWRDWERWVESDGYGLLNNSLIEIFVRV